ncbi:hypothetical protein BDZ97DRAFT_1758215 [Flammula alnicola]|nr:hypothetical protein BDZ97DRAFT_1758215 [Flammula alnicola]
MVMASMQVHLFDRSIWRVEIDTSWDPIDYDQSWPSSYADGGMVKWSKATSTAEGDIEIAFPEIRQVSFWFAGNIYDLERALPHALELPSAFHDRPTEYELFIRLFGDPLVRHSEIPVQKLALRIQVQDMRTPLLHHQSQDVTCDFLNGYAFGNVFGIGIQSTAGWWIVKDVKLKTQAVTRVLSISISQSAPFFGETIELDISLASGNLSEIISVSIPVTHHVLYSSERQAFKGSFLFQGSMPSVFLAIPPTIKTSAQSPPILALRRSHTVAYSSSYLILTSPDGAGVDILGQDFWVKSLPSNKLSWMIVPIGRTSWGLDWHGPSAKDAWSALEALTSILQSDVYGLPESLHIPPHTQVVVIGHSNGGQGTWENDSFGLSGNANFDCSHTSAAYIKSQAYIPLTLARSAHFIDPALRAILESSLTPDDNDLHLSNLVDTPVLAIHGGDDENVPVWHSREATATLKAWYPSANITFKEDPGEGHWYSYVLNSPEAQIFLDNILSNVVLFTVGELIKRQYLEDKRISHPLQAPGRIQISPVHNASLIFFIYIIESTPKLFRSTLHGTPSSPFAKKVLDRNRTPVRVINSTIQVEARKFNKAGQAILFSHPHPTRVDSESFMLFILYNDGSGLERALRLFPFRTGVAIPDWLVVGNKMDNFGAGGIEAAGVWAMDWKFSEAMSWS